MPFTTRGVVVDLQDNQGTLIAPLSYQGQVEHFTVPSGFVTDFASTPRLLASVAPSIGKWTRAAVLHDWFCVLLAQGQSPVSSRDADGLFRRTLREAGVGLILRWLMWTAVRWGAVANPARRAGWWRDAPLVLTISAMVVKLLLIVVVLLRYLL